MLNNSVQSWSSSRSTNAQCWSSKGSAGADAGLDRPAEGGMAAHQEEMAALLHKATEVEEHSKVRVPKPTLQK